MVARGDREEALSRFDAVPRGRGPAGEGAIRVRAGDPVRVEPLPLLVAAERCRGRGVEAAVDRLRGKPVSAQAELEHGHVPADRPDAELALSEERPAATTECATRRAMPRRPVTRTPLVRWNATSARRGQRTADAVDRARIEPVRAQPDLERGDARTGREPIWSEHEDANGHRDADDGEATHAETFAARLPPVLPPGRARSRGYNPAAAFPGSSIGRASGC